MGCYVNGPGEAAEADLGVVAAGTFARIYRRGKVIDAKAPFAEVTARMTELIRTFHDEPAAEPLDGATARAVE
jgi:4-hydroxy-3-methylbut-2-en-1-yl diphosphate synthase IspG/GcpE